MKKKDKTIKFDLSEDFLLDSAEERFHDGDYLAALTLLNKRGDLYAPSADALALYADIYEELEVYDLAADAWFRFLDVCNEADFEEGYEGLAVAFMNMNDDSLPDFYYRKAMMRKGDGQDDYNGFSIADDAEEEQSFDQDEFRQMAKELLDSVTRPKFSVVHDVDKAGDPEAYSEGTELFRQGEWEKAINRLEDVGKECEDFPSARGLIAMCHLLLGEEEAAQRECERHLKSFPDNVKLLTAYCAVLGAREKKEKARATAERLARLNVDATDDLYRVASALCETGLHEKAYEKLCILKERIPFDPNILYFHAVASYRTDKLEDAIASLEQLTTVYPRKAIAKFFLRRLRNLRDGGGEPVNMTYVYRMPEQEYTAVAEFLIAAVDLEGEEIASRFGEVEEFYRMAFDELEGRDEKIKLIAVKVALKTRSDAFLRDILLDYSGNDSIKYSVLHDLVTRNEGESFGVVLGNFYREFFIHRIEIGKQKRSEFLKAYADAYCKCVLVDGGDGEKMCAVAEDLYDSLDEMGALSYADDRAELAAAIYRETRIKDGVRSLKKIAEQFGADVKRVRAILNYIV